MTSAFIIARRMTATACIAAIFLCFPAFVDAQTSPPPPAQVPLQKTIDQGAPEIAASFRVMAASPVRQDDIAIAASRRSGGKFL